MKEKETPTLTDALKRIKQMELELLNLIPVCDEIQLMRIEGIIDHLISEKKRLTSIQNLFIDSIINKIK